VPDDIAGAAGEPIEIEMAGRRATNDRRGLDRFDAWRRADLRACVRRQLFFDLRFQGKNFG
jgi:hypothetical protein